MLVDRPFLMHNFCAVINGEAVAFWEDQSKASLALIMALIVLDQEEPKMPQAAGCVHLFAREQGTTLLDTKAAISFCVPIC